MFDPQVAVPALQLAPPKQQGAGAEVQLSILVRSEPSIPEDVLDRQIVEASEQVPVSWGA